LNYVKLGLDETLVSYLVSLWNQSYI
jgi:hypothetical protein